MINLDLTADEQEAYVAALSGSHRLRLALRILDRDEKPVGSLTAPVKTVISGAVQIDTSAAVTRSLELELHDPDRGLRFEADSPADGAVYADHFITADREIYVEELAKWVAVPIFTGPLTDYERTGEVVRLTAQGKERLMLDPHLATRGYTVRRRTRLDEAIEKVARRAGERRFNLPTLSHRLRRPRAVTPESAPWLVLKGGEQNEKGRKIPGLIERIEGDYQIFYNGRGELTVRPREQSVAFRFTGSEVVSEHPKISYSTEDFRNTVVVRGGKPKNRKRAARARVSLPANHPLSPQSLARNGEPRYLTEFVDADGLKTDRACERHGEKILKRVSSEGVGAEFTALVVPHLEEGDQIRLELDNENMAFRLERATIPLTADPMTVGANTPVRR